MKYGYRGEPEWEASDTWMLVGIVFACLVVYCLFLRSENEAQEERLTKLEKTAPAVEKKITVTVPTNFVCTELVKTTDRILMECAVPKK